MHLSFNRIPPTFSLFPLIHQFQLANSSGISVHAENALHLTKNEKIYEKKKYIYIYGPLCVTRTKGAIISGVCVCLPDLFHERHQPTRLAHMKYVYIVIPVSSVSAMGSVCRSFGPDHLIARPELITENFFLHPYTRSTI